MILDTTFLIDLMKGDNDACEKMKFLNKSQIPISITAVSVFQLFSGLGRSLKPSSELEKIHTVLHQQIVWPLNDFNSEIGGKVHGELIKNGNPINALDSMIAGISLHHKETVLTRNTKHFTRISSLKVESY